MIERKPLTEVVAELEAENARLKTENRKLWNALGHISEFAHDLLVQRRTGEAADAAADRVMVTPHFPSDRNAGIIELTTTTTPTGQEKAETKTPPCTDCVYSTVREVGGEFRRYCLKDSVVIGDGVIKCDWCIKG